MAGTEGTKPLLTMFWGGGGGAGGGPPPPPRPQRQSRE
jgi:hypothetical protein